MNRPLLWKLCVVIAAGTVALFYVINVLTSRAEEGMSYIAVEHREQLNAWARHAENLYARGQTQALDEWLQELQQQEQTWAAVVESDLTWVAGGPINERFLDAFTLGRGVDWKIHLYFPGNPIIEFRIAGMHTHFSILLPQRMRPGIYWGYTNVALQIILPIILLILLAAVIYRHIMAPVSALEKGARAFSRGEFDVRVRQLLGNRSDELAELAGTFDKMADRLQGLIVSQRQLISDLSHELRTPLARMDVAIANLENSASAENIDRVSKESAHIRHLVEGTLTLAWLENEKPNLTSETLDLVDLIDVLSQDAKFEFGGSELICNMPESAPLHHSNHRALGQALENIIRNAMRYTPPSGVVTLTLGVNDTSYLICVADQGPGVPEAALQQIFEPFYRVDQARHKLDAATDGFGLGLALAHRQIAALGGSVFARNGVKGGLKIFVELPRPTGA